MRKSKGVSLEHYHSRNGFLFVLPWAIGFLLFFLIPILQSILFSFCDVNVGTSGFKLSFIGLKNFYYAFFESPKYVDNLVDTLYAFAYQIPIVIILSAIISIVLNSDFKGRTVFRALFFIPVIISTGVVMEYIAGDTMMEDMRSVSGAGSSAYLDGLIDFEKVFTQLNLPEKVTDIITKYVNDIFDLVWKCGIQILLFISGLQTIPDHLYEVAKVDGATKWEEFWYVTFPGLGNAIVLVLIYTGVDFCISNDNTVMSQAYTLLSQQQAYGKSSAMIWAYFVISTVIIALLFLAYRHFCLKKWE